MANIVAGYFTEAQNHNDLEYDLESAGFSDEDYTVYLNEGSPNYLVSVITNYEVERDNAQVIFNEHHANKTYFFENLDRNISYNDLKKLIEIKAKTQIQDAPNLKQKDTSTGMNDEIIFGN